MRKILLFIIILLILLYSFLPFKSIKSKNEYRGIFVSYIELQNNIKNDNIKICKENINKMIMNLKSLNFNLIILQVRSFSDAIYESKIFPWSKYISSKEGISPGFDVLDYFIEICHKNNIYLFAWINPFRITKNNDINNISKINPAYKYLGTRNIIIDNGIFYNPSSNEVLNLILSGISEILENYKVDGLLFDDYFYPNNNCDYIEYIKYIAINNYISYDDYRYMIINNLISKTHKLCRKYKVLFGVSPDGNISNNYNTHFADIKTWLSSDLYIDFIMPQVYYGLFNQSKDFKGVIDEWESYIKNDNIIFMIALAFYKVGKEDFYARNGSLEWINNNDIIMKEIILSRNLNFYGGFCLFRYGFLFDDKYFTHNTSFEINNMKKIIK